MASNYDKLKGPNWIVASVATLFVIGLKLSWEETFPVCAWIFFGFAAIIFKTVQCDHVHNWDFLNLDFFQVQIYVK